MFAAQLLAAESVRVRRAWGPFQRWHSIAAIQGDITSRMRRPNCIGCDDDYWISMAEDRLRAKTPQKKFFFHQSEVTVNTKHLSKNKREMEHKTMKMSGVKGYVVHMHDRN